ncbi:hypothetical protein T265_11662 [Opisthorchis viverrini]|uniref:Uncharacterized protein n=1 Tax=Opisthorchis viverrini TaxID=6198 RepID=A0A074ZWR7_OPIVI|nr:hypothetical protein T265_11662 [Opisthorchis viverrini]KER19614.1 hypothetical protein T265_11662 [Opisthorchis viverrini]
MNTSAVVPFWYAVATLPEESTSAEQSPGSSSVDRTSRDAEAGFETRTSVAWKPSYIISTVVVVEDLNVKVGRPSAAASHSAVNTPPSNEAAATFFTNLEVSDRFRYEIFVQAGMAPTYPQRRSLTSAAT